MSFGYIPGPSRARNVVKAVLGVTNLIKRIQGHAVMEALQLGPNTTCLDIGCGQGYFTYEIAKRSPAVGIDPRVAAPVKRMRIPSEMKEGLNWLVGSGGDLPIRSESIDRIILSEVLQMLADYRPMLFESSRVLKKDGIVVVVTGVDDVWDQFYSRSRVVRLLSRRGLLPGTFPEYKQMFNRNTGAHDNTLFYERDLESKFKECGFSVQNKSYAFRKWNSKLLFYVQMAALILGKKVYGPWLFLLYPLCILVEAVDRKSKRLGAIFVLRLT